MGFIHPFFFISNIFQPMFLEMDTEQQLKAKTDEPRIENAFLSHKINKYTGFGAWSLELIRKIVLQNF